MRVLDDILITEEGTVIDRDTGEVVEDTLRGVVYEYVQGLSDKLKNAPVRSVLDLKMVRCMEDFNDLSEGRCIGTTRPVMVNSVVDGTRGYRVNGMLSDKATMLFTEIGMRCVYRNVSHYSVKDVMRSAGVQKTTYHKSLKDLIKGGLIKDTKVKQKRGYKMVLVHPDYFYCSKSDRMRAKDCYRWFTGGSDLGILQPSLIKIR